MDIRYSGSPHDVKHYDTAQLRNEFLIEKLFAADEFLPVYSHVDRMLTIGVMPVSTPLAADAHIQATDLGVSHFLERRELGVINIGGSGSVTADGNRYAMNRLDGLYIGMGSRDVVFESDDAANPAKFYCSSAPAHRRFDTRLITLEDAKHVALGDLKTSNKRVIHQFIHPDVLETCQLSMGCTMLEEGCVWNSMPCHTHERRMEVYCYFDVPADNIVFHMMGQPQELRTVVLQNEQSVISPSWSVHCGCGTANYSFIWSMAGENRTFTDMDAVKVCDMR